MRQPYEATSLPDMTGRTEDAAPSKREALRCLMARGYTGPQAQERVREFFRGPQRTYREYLAWLMQDVPGGRKQRPVARPDRDYRVTLV